MVRTPSADRLRLRAYRPVGAQLVAAGLAERAGQRRRRYRWTWVTCAVDVDRPKACDHTGVRSGVPAAAWAEQQVAAVRDDPAGRITLMERCYYGPFGQAPRHLPFRRAAMAFMRWRSEERRV